MNLFYNLMTDRKPLHRFAEKKMKRIYAITFILFMGISVPAQHKGAIGTDLGKMIGNSIINISAGYGFASRWSATWHTEINTEPFCKEADQEHEEHKEEFIEPQERRETTYRNSLSVEYWTYTTYEGFFLKTGCRCGTDLECIIGAGYFIPIWRGMKAILSYENDILASLRGGKPTGTGITIGIYWIIQKHNS